MGLMVVMGVLDGLLKELCLCVLKVPNHYKVIIGNIQSQVALAVSQSVESG